MAQQDWLSFLMGQKPSGGTDWLGQVPSSQPGPFDLMSQQPNVRGWLMAPGTPLMRSSPTMKGTTARPPKTTGDAVPLAPGTPGATISLDDIKTAALQTGLGEEGARVAMAIARTEGALSGAVGDQSIGGSYGPYQFYTKGMLPAYAASLGLDVPAAGEYARQHPLEAAAWALSGYLGKAIKEGMAKGLTGPALATYAQRVGQRSQNPERAGTVYASMFK